MTVVYEQLRTSEALADACRRFHVRRLDLFGSAATGRGFDANRSDIDVLVEFTPSARDTYTESWFGLRETLEDLSGRSVDLLTDGSFVNPYLRRRVEAEKRVLYRAD